MIGKFKKTGLKYPVDINVELTLGQPEVSAPPDFPQRPPTVSESCRPHLWSCNPSSWPLSGRQGSHPERLWIINTMIMQNNVYKANGE